MATVVLIYNEVPPSSNQNQGVGGRGHPKAVARTKGRWEGIFAMLLLSERVPRGLKWVRATAELQFKDKRRRDSDNYYFPISKPLGDALVRGDWLPDDTPDFYEFERVRINPERLEGAGPLVKGRLTLTLEYEPRDESLAPGALGESWRRAA